jgi:hypothetical protein
MTLIGAIETPTPKTISPKLQIRRGNHSVRRAGPQVRLIAAFAASMLAGCGLEASYPEARTPDTSAAQSSVSAPADAPTSAPGAQPTEQRATMDLPDSEILRAISRRAVVDITTTHRGFTPSLIAVTSCYENLQPDDLEARIYCLQLDTAAWFVESTAPQQWQDMDAASNDYLTDARFYERRWRETPPLADTPEAAAQRRANLAMLEAAAGAAIREYVETLMSDEPEKPARVAESAEEVTWPQ